MSVSIDDVLIGEYYVITPEGKLYYPEEFKTDDECFKALIEKEALKTGRKARARSPHIDFLKRLNIAEQEPMSDAGHLSYLPKGALIVDLLMDYTLNIALKYGAMPVKTSIMYDLSDNAIKEHANLFGQRMYKVKPAKREFVLRYAACFGQFALLRRHYLTYNNLPFKIFEVADSYRYEQRGELSGLARVRRFYMPDLHVLTKDLEEAKAEFKKLFKLILDEGYKFGWRYYNLYNIVYDFFKNEFNFILELLNIEAKPALVYITEPNKYYWVINIEFHYIDSQMRPLETATVQIDIGNSKRFGITYIDKNGAKKYPIILHTAIHGSIERFLYEFLEEAAKMIENGKKPMLPVWLSPTQVRLIPISKSYIDFSIKILEALKEKCIRADIDDRDLTVARKVREAEREWIPYIVLIGEKEVKSNMLTVRIREIDQEVKLSLNELINIIEKKTCGYPKRPLYYDVFLSKRPSIV